MRTLVILAALFAVSFAYNAEIERAFQTWRVENHKFYPSANEYQKRFSVFAENFQRVEKHNAEGHSYEVGLNLFSDLTTEEFRALYTMNNLPADNAKSALVHIATGAQLPESIDHRERGIVNPIKNQGQCGSCYAFGAMASVEAAWTQAGNQLTRLSEQEIIDCSWSLGNQGCNGGWHNWVMDYIVNNKGVDTEDSYPYLAKANRTCRAAQGVFGARIQSRVAVGTSDADLLSAVAETVVAVAIDAGQFGFQSYKSGVYDDAKCTTRLNHAVAAVGYGTQDGKDYWIVRNSWGTTWGNKGYILMVRGKNMCGINSKNFYATA